MGLFSKKNPRPPGAGREGEETSNPLVDPPLQLGPLVGARPRLPTLDSDGHPPAIYRTYVALTNDFLGTVLLPSSRH